MNPHSHQCQAQILTTFSVINLIFLQLNSKASLHKRSRRV